MSDIVKLNPLYTFDNFMVGNNIQAYDTCVAVAEQPGRNEYNPLFIYGGSGVGKTHLIQAITHHIISHNQDIIVIYISAEMFVDQLIDAISKNNTEEFKANYKQINMLIIEDIHDIIGKERIEKELLEIVKYLNENQVQMIFSSDRLPKEFFELGAGLKPKSVWGILSRIPSPDYETRVKIIRKKAEIKGLNDIQDDIVSYMACNVASDIRLIEGILNKICIYRKEEHSTVTIEYLRKIMKDFVLEPPQIPLEKIMLIVAEYYEISVEDILSNKRMKNINQARRIYIYFSHMFTNKTLQEIGWSLGIIDEEYIMRALYRIKEQKRNDVKLNDQLDEITRIIKDRFMYWR